MIYVLEKRRRSNLGQRMWRPIQEFELKEKAELEKEKLNNEDSIFEYTVTEKPR